jgi:hypothetical protein
VARRITGTGSVTEQLLRWVGAVMILGILAGALLFFVLYFLIDLPDPNRDFESQRTDVYYSDGKHKIGSFAVQERERVPLGEVSEYMQAAIIAAEDRSFYSNRGIDIRGIVRAARNNASSGAITGGGSTITQQYVKVLYLSQERSYIRKMREAILSIKIHNRMSKQEILNGYLNLIYFGNGAYGVEVREHVHAATKGLTHRLEVERAGLRAFLGFVALHPATYRLMRQAEFVEPVAFKRFYTELSGDYARGLQRGIEEKQIEPLEPEITAYALMGIADFLGMRYVLWDSSVDLDRVVEVAMRLVRGGLEPK